MRRIDDNSRTKSIDLSSNQKFPMFLFDEILETKSGTKAFKDKKAQDFLERIKKLSGMTWQEITDSDRHSFGTEKIEFSEFNGKIPEKFKGKKILAFRYSDLLPFVGYRDGEKFHVLAVDTDFKLYNHGN